eukprot:1155152-Pelagomonas_calceolata.AAC.9
MKCSVAAAPVSAHDATTRSLGSGGKQGDVQVSLVKQASLTCLLSRTIAGSLGCCTGAGRQGTTTAGLLGSTNGRSPGFWGSSQNLQE